MSEDPVDDRIPAAGYPATPTTTGGKVPEGRRFHLLKRDRLMGAGFIAAIWAAAIGGRFYEPLQVTAAIIAVAGFIVFIPILMRRYY